MSQKPTYEELEKRIHELEPAEASLRASEARYRAIVEKSPMGIAIVNDQFQYTYANNEFINIAGYPKEEIIGANFFFLLAEESKQLSIERYTKRQRGESVPDRYEVSFIKKNGDRRIGEVQSNVFMDAEGRANSLLQVYDITERNLAEKALQESEKKYRILIENAGEAVFVAQDGWLKFVNPSTETIIGHSKETLTSKPFTEFIHPDDRKMVLDRHFKRMQGDDIPYRYAFRIKTESEETRWVELNSVLIEWEGRPATLIFLSDIHDRVQMEDALRKSEEKFRFLAEKMGDIIWTMDLNFKTTYVSPSIERLHGFTPEERKLQKLEDTITPESLITVMNVFQTEMEREKTGGFDPDRTIVLELEYYHKDGSTSWMESIIKGMRNASGELIGVYGLSRDITEKKHAEAEKEKLQSMLNQAQKMESVGRLAGGVAHDFNNMLGVILGHTELVLKKADLNQPAQNSIKEIQRAAQRAADLTSQLLSFARKQTIFPKQLFLNETVSDMITMLRRLIGEGIHLIWMPGAHLWPVRMDPAQVDQILANLCVNARDAIHDKSGGVGNIAIKTENVSLDHAFCKGHPDFSPGDYVLLEVRDDGCGMDAEITEKLFEPFFTTKAVGKGTGLGLATIYGIVRQNNGIIKVFSQPEQGTTFDIYMPRDTDAAALPQEKIPQKKPAGGTETILVVEDEPAVLDMTRLMLENMGYRPLTAGSPSDAIHIAESHAGSIDLLMTDVIMPEMNGRDLAGRLSAKYPHLKVLFMSGYTADVINHRGVLDDNVHFIQKPFTMKELADGVRDALKKGEG
jgi:PAS domain S-box-containing protein